MAPQFNSQETPEEQQAEQLLSQTQAAAAVQLDSLQVISLFFSLTSRRLYLCSHVLTACTCVCILYTVRCVSLCAVGGAANRAAGEAPGRSHHLSVSGPESRGRSQRTDGGQRSGALHLCQQVETMSPKEHTPTHTHLLDVL